MRQQAVGPFHRSQFLPLVFIPLWLFQSIDSEQLVIEQLYHENILLAKEFQPNVACDCGFERVY